MSWRTPESYWGVGDLASPEELERELGIVCGEMNGFIDRDNLGEEAIETAAIEPMAVVAMYSNMEGDLTTLFDTIITTGDVGWQPIPDLIRGIETSDGVIFVHAAIGYIDPDSLDGNIGIRLDGRVLWSTSVSILNSSYPNLNGLNLTAVLPVSAGEHLVEVVVRGGVSWATTDFEYDLYSGRLIIREAAR